MKNLKELAEEIEKTTTLAAKELDDFPVAVRAGWGARLVQAKADLPLLRAEYRNLLLSSGIAIFVTGDAAKALEFAQLVRSSGEGVAVDAEALYKRLADAIDPTMSPARTWGVQQTHKLHLTLTEIMHEIGLPKVVAPPHNDSIVLPTHRNVQDYIRKIQLASDNGDLLRSYVQHLTVQDALKIGYTSSLTPVVVMNATASDTSALSLGFGKGAAQVTVGVDDVVDEAFMVKAFKDINKRLRAKKQ